MRPSCKIMPPAICTSKCLRPIVRKLASRTTAKASGRISAKMRLRLCFNFSFKRSFSSGIATFNIACFKSCSWLSICADLFFKCVLNSLVLADRSLSVKALILASKALTASTVQATSTILFIEGEGISACRLIFKRGNLFLIAACLLLRIAFLIKPSIITPTCF